MTESADRMSNGVAQRGVAIGAWRLASLFSVALALASCGDGEPPSDLGDARAEDAGARRDGGSSERDAAMDGAIAAEDGGAIDASPAGDAGTDASAWDAGPPDAGRDAGPPPYGTFTAVRRDSAEAPPYGHYVYLPSTYEDDPDYLWPTIIAFPGSGERGDGSGQLTRILNRGLPKVINLGHLPAPANYQFIIIAAQDPRPAEGMPEFPTNSELETFFDWLDAHYRIDTSRRYLTGLSAGGFTTWGYGRNGGARVAAYVPVSANDGAGTACAFAHRPVWIFHGLLDPNPRTAVTMAAAARDKVNACSPDEPARLTVISIGGHDDLTWVPIWDLTAMTDGHIDPGYDPYDESIYAWLLRHHL